MKSDQEREKKNSVSIAETAAAASVGVYRDDGVAVFVAKDYAAQWEVVPSA